MPVLFTCFSRAALTAAVGVVLAAGLIAGSGTSAKLAVIMVLGAAFAASLFWLRIPQRRYWMGLFFLTAPFDVSKALVPPLDRFYSPGLYVTIGEAVMLPLGLVWSFEQIFIRRLRLPFTALDALACGFLALVWLGALHSQTGILGYASALSYSLYVLAFYVVSHALRTKSEVRLMLKMMLIGFAFQTLHVIVQLATHSFLPLPGSKMAGSGAGVDAQARLMDSLLNPVFRPIGAFEHPNSLADYLTLLLPPALAFVLMGRRRLPARAWQVAALMLAASGSLLLLTLSRGGWAACLLSGAFVGGVFWRKRLIGTGHVLAFAGLLLSALMAFAIAYPQVVLRLTEPDSRSTESRLVLTDQALTIIKAHPLWGVGFGGYNRAGQEYIPPTFALISEDYQKQLLELVVHNHYLLLAAELGVPAMLYWIYLMFSFVRQAWPLSQWRDPGMFALGVGMAGALAGQMLYLTSDNYYVDIRVFLLWLTAGVLQALTLMCRERTLGENGTCRQVAAP